MQARDSLLDLNQSEKKFQHIQAQYADLPSKPPEKQNSLEGEISKKISPYINPIYRPPCKPPNIQNTHRERIWVLEKESLPYAESV